MSHAKFWERTDYTVKKVSDIPVPSRDVTYQMLLTFFYSVPVKTKPHLYTDVG
jgi:hypothetical protein